MILRATRAWWNFFHRFSLIAKADQFDHLVILGLKLLECKECKLDASDYYNSLSTDKKPYEKLGYLHNHVNIKLGKPIWSDLSEFIKKYSDIFVDENPQNQIDWDIFLSYYFELIFEISKYLPSKSYSDFQEFSGYISDYLPLKRGVHYSIQIGGQQSDDIFKRTYEYYVQIKNDLSGTRELDKKPVFQSYKSIYGVTSAKSKKRKPCKSCEAKRRALAQQKEKTKQHNREVLQKKIEFSQSSKPVPASIQPQSKVIQPQSKVIKPKPANAKPISNIKPVSSAKPVSSTKPPLTLNHPPVPKQVPKPTTISRPPLIPKPVSQTMTKQLLRPALPPIMPKPEPKIKVTQHVIPRPLPRVRQLLPRPLQPGTIRPQPKVIPIIPKQQVSLLSNRSKIQQASNIPKRPSTIIRKKILPRPIKN